MHRGPCSSHTFSRLLFLGLVASLVVPLRCKRLSELASSPAPDADPSAVEGRASAEAGTDSDDGEEERAQVPFEIDAVHGRQKPTLSPPWHEPGGAWTFFDAHLSDGTRFGFGLEDGNSGSDMTFAKAMLTVPDADAGARLVSSFAEAFGSETPPPRARAPLKIGPISAAVFGRNVARHPTGFSGKGRWTTTKLFLHRARIEAEVYLNFTLGSRRGEFSEKDRDYADDMIAFLALELRDGPRPSRTPDTDPQISAIGPKFDGWRTLGDKDAQFLGFAASGKRVFYTMPDGTRTRILEAPTEDPSASVEVVRAEHHVEEFQCAAAGPICLLIESRPAERGLLSSKDRREVFVLNRKNNKENKETRRALVGAWGNGATSTAVAVAPDGSYVALAEWRPKSDGHGSARRVHLLPMASDAATVVEVRDQEVDVIGWTGAGPSLRAIVQQGLESEESPAPSWMSVDPRTGARTDLAVAPVGMVRSGAISPDGKHRVTCNGTDEIAVTDVVTGATRRFTVHEDDRRALADGCVRWASARFLRFDTARLGFIDIRTMKLSYATEGDEDLGELSLDDKFSVAVSSTSEGLRLSRVVLR